MILAQAAKSDLVADIATSLVMCIAMTAAVRLGYRPLVEFIRAKEGKFSDVLQGKLLMDIPPRAATVASVLAMLMLGMIAYAITSSWIGFLLAAGAGAVLPATVLGILARRRLAKLEEQLVPGIQTLASGVRAGLNLVQSIELVARDGPRPLKQEFAHLAREYAYGVPLGEAMNKAAARIGSGDYRLLFTALQTHRERGGDLGETLDRIADSIREIQRLEKRVEALTAQGRAQARWLAAMPPILLGFLYFIDKERTLTLFQTDLGKLILFGIVMLNVIGFLWIRKIVSVDI